MTRFRSYLFLSITASAIGFITNIVVSRFFGPEIRGDFAVYMAIAAIAAPLTLTGLHYDTVINNKSVDPKKILLIPLASILFAFAITETIDPSKNTLISALFIYGSTLHYALLYICQSLSLDAYGKFRIAQAAGSLLLSTTLYTLLDTATNILLISYLAPYTIISLLILRRLNNQGRISSTPPPSPKNKDVIFFYITESVSALIVNVDKIFLSFFLSDSDVGRYSAVFITTRAVNQVFQPAAVYLFNSWRQGANGTIKIINKVIALSALSSITLSVPLYFYGDSFIQLIFGEKFDNLGITLIILLTESFASGASWIITSAHQAKKRNLSLLLSQVFSLSLYLILFLILTETMSINLASAILLATSVIRLLINYIQLISKDGKNDESFYSR